MNDPNKPNAVSPPPPSGPARGAAQSAPSAGAGDGGYDLVEEAAPAPPAAAPRDEYAVLDPAPPAPPLPPAPTRDDTPAAGVPSAASDPARASTFQAASDDDESVPSAAEVEEQPTVDEAWTRWGEWKEPLTQAGVVIGLILLVQFGGVWVTAILLLGALLYGLYCIAISLEVPVRVTPEQAVREFYASLGHRLPNYRRMHQLLTAQAKRSARFGGFAGFRSYWHDEVAGLARSAIWLRPLDFRIEGFKCRYNPDRTLATVRYKIEVFPRGSAGEPLAEFNMRHAAVKGPDGQWYINSGELPERAVSE